MSDDKVIEAINDINDPLSAEADPASTTDNPEEAKAVDPEEGGEENKKVDLEEEKPEEKPVNKAKEQRSKQIDTWSERYYNGEVKLEEVPKWIQDEITKANAAPDREADDDAKFEARMAKRDDETLYTSQKKILDDTKLVGDQADIVSKEYKRNRASNLPVGRSLELAMSVAKVQVQKTARPKNPVTSGSEEAPKNGAAYSERRKSMTLAERRKELLAEIGN